MSREDFQPITVILDETNYNHWSFLMKSFLKGRSMWKYVDGTEKAPTAGTSGVREKDKEGTTVDAKESWEVNNHKILTWISNTIITSISMQLTTFEVAKEASGFLQKRYTQINFAQRYKLEQDIRAMQQNDQSISDFHSKMSLIWNQLAMEPKFTVDLALWDKHREETRLVQLLMTLREEFEVVRDVILHRSPLPTVEAALSKLIDEETRKRVNSKISGVFATPSIRPNFNNQRNSLPIPMPSTQRDLSQV
ncbi:uncharacterized protein LOC113311802 [Papaver somniferum]|uniref:uncharacterized protein LOC113311802 n=1 Tax=Papaver somniferum TaxID=3469 RepID=UPI000E700391|nr:uncharacterized protein LOC113311802 [Papaver somniferum]